MTPNAPEVTVYPSEEQLERWDNRREELGGGSRSQFVADMVEAGIKADRGFSADITPDEPVQDLRRQRNDLKQELEHARDRIERLESELHRGERETILEFVGENPGADYDDVVRHVIDTLPERINRNLEEMEGDELEHDPETGGYHLAESTNSVDT